MRISTNSQRGIKHFSDAWVRRFFHGEKSVADSVKRPFRLTLLFLGICVFTLVQIIRSFGVISNWAFFSEYFDPLLGVITVEGALFSAIGIILIYGIWFRKAWSPKLLLWTSVIYTVIYWFDFVLLAGQEERLQNYLFMLIANALILALILFILSSRPTRKYFGEIDGK